jgi:hypothetical protein
LDTCCLPGSVSNVSTIDYSARNSIMQVAFCATSTLLGARSGVVRIAANLEVSGSTRILSAGLG